MMSSFFRSITVWAVVVGVCCVNVGFCLRAAEQDAAEAVLHMAPFVADITPAVGEPICGGLCPPTESVEHPLLAKGVVLRDRDHVYVLCALDLCALVGETYDRMRAGLAEAAGTTPSRVALHALHLHTANTLDMPSQRLIEGHDGIPTITTPAYVRKVSGNTAEAIRVAMGGLQRVTHVGASQVKVERVASSRRLRQPDGSITARMSATRDADLQQLPEGRIDPWLRTIGFYDGRTPLAHLHYYATHPQSFYNDGRVTYDVPGIARERLEGATGVPQIYFTGCAGDVAMGKYNDGSVDARGELADRLYAAMTKAVAEISLEPVSAVDFATTHVQFSARPEAEFSEAAARRALQDQHASAAARIKAASILAWIERSQAEMAIELSCLAIGPVRILRLPGEAFIDYQLWAQQISPSTLVAVAAYADCGMWYIPTDEAYHDRGGYEQTWAFAAPVEVPLRNAMAKMLNATSSSTAGAGASAAAPGPAGP